MTKRTMPEGTKQTQEWIAVEDLAVDHAYQRPLGERKIARMMKDFDPDLVGELVVSRRDDGTNVLLDGQQRREVVARLWGGKQQLPCLVYHGLTVEREAELFVGHNVLGTKPSAVEIFKARVASGDATAVDVERILRRLGLRVQTGKGAGIIAAASTLQDLHQKAGPAALTEALTLMVEAGMAREEALSGDILSGLALLLVRHPSIDRKRIRVVLEGIIPRRFMAVVRTSHADTSHAISGVFTGTVARHLLALYNRGKRTGRLDWVEPVQRTYWTPAKARKAE